MEPIAAFWHFVNFFASSFGVALVAAMLTKTIFKTMTANATLWRLFSFAFVTCACIAVAGLVIWGRDGLMSTYGLMVLGAAIALRVAAMKGPAAAA